MIMQENRSFDSYFGTYPGRERDPGRACACRTRSTAAASRPFTTHDDENFGGPHGVKAAFEGDIDGGAMDGFVGEAEKSQKCRAAPTRTAALSAGEAEAEPNGERCARRDGLPRRA